MSLKKVGSPAKISVVKQSSFSIDENMLAQLLLKDWPSKKISVDTLHDALKSIGVDNYASEDLSSLINRLQAIGFEISK